MKFSRVALPSYVLAVGCLLSWPLLTGCTGPPSGGGSNETNSTLTSGTETASESEDYSNTTN